MTTRITYSTSVIRQMFDNCRRFSYPGASNFLQALPARSSPFFKVPNKHRRGWQVALRSQSLRKFSIPSLISLNARSLLNKIDDLRCLLLSRLYHNTGVILVQESWLSNSIDNELINVANLSVFRADRPNSKKVGSGGVVTYVHNERCSTTKVLFSCNVNNIEALTVKCKSPCLPKFKHIIITNVCIPPNVSHTHVTSFLIL